MKLRSISNFASVAALAACLPLGMSSARAVSNDSVPVAGDAVIQPSQFQRVEWNEERRAQLRRAFWLIEHSDGDYAGHRVKAMEHIKKVGEMLGVDLHGKGYGEGIKQAKSDERMHEARDLLKEVVRESDGKEKDILMSAVSEVNHALKVN